MGNITRQDWHNPNLARREIVNRNHVEVVVDLQVSVLEKVVENKFRVRIFFESILPQGFEFLADKVTIAED